MTNIDGFSERLKIAIKGESSYGFAKKCGFSESLIRKYLSGASAPGLEKAVVIAGAAGVSLDWLATGKGEPDISSQGNHVPTAEGDYEVSSGLSAPLTVRDKQAYFARARKAAVEDISNHKDRMPAGLPTTLYARLAGPLAELVPNDQAQREFVLECAINILRAATSDNIPDMLHFEEGDLRNAISIAASTYAMESKRQAEQSRAIQASVSATSKLMSDENPDDRG